MINFFSIGEAARLSGLTIETLRHYDRIGLLKPAKVDKQSGYRYYTDEELVYLEVISFCRKNNMPLTEIKNIFQEDFLYTVSFLKETEQRIDEEINRLKQTKKQIFNLRNQLQNSLISPINDFYIKHFNRRVVVLANHLNEATIENFHKLHDELYTKLGQNAHEKFSFDNSANFLISLKPNMQIAKMFSVCTKFENSRNLEYLQAGNYLCYMCSENEKEKVIQEILLMAREKYGIEPDDIVLSVIFTGMFQWKYEIQIFLGQL